MAFSYKDYIESQKVKEYEDQLNAVMGNKPSEWNKDKNYAAVQSALDKYNNRGKFSYDLNGDMLYQQYKDQYITQGKQAMMDAMGQASAMTGGYGNSYAQTVGQQTYQGYLQGLNDKIPELYQLAYDKYNQEGQDLLNQYSLAKDQYDTAYGEYQDSVSRWNADRDYASNMYNTERNYDYSQYADAYNRAFAQYQQDVSESQWNKEYDLQKSSADQSSTIASLQSQLNGMIDPNDIEVDENGNILSVNGYNISSGNTSDSNKKLTERTWKVEDNGGINWFGGIDNNAKIVDSDGNVYSLDKLVKALQTEGMSKSEAKEYVKNLQKRLGI